MKHFSVVSDIETGVPLVVMIKDGRNVSAYGINEFGKEIISSSFKDGKFISSDGLSKSPYRPMTEKIKTIFESIEENAESKNYTSGEIANFGKRFSERTKTNFSGKSNSILENPISVFSKKSASVSFKAQKFLSLSNKSSIISFVKTNRVRFNSKTGKFFVPGLKTISEKIERLAPGSVSSRIGMEISGFSGNIKVPRRAERRAKSLSCEDNKKSVNRIESSIISKSRRF